MGTIASVLQWTCSNSNCRYINPTESLKCINCGNIRRIKIPSYLASPDEYDDDYDDDDDEDGYGNYDDSPTQSTKNLTRKQRTKTTNSDHCDNTLPGYVEINSNGYFCICIIFLFDFIWKIWQISNYNMNDAYIKYGV